MRRCLEGADVLVQGIQRALPIRHDIDYLEPNPVFRPHMARPAFDQENPMRDYLKFYINGEWVDPVTPRTLR